MKTDHSDNLHGQTSAPESAGKGRAKLATAFSAFALLIAAAIGAYFMSATVPVSAASESHSSGGEAPKHVDLPGSKDNAKDIDPKVGVDEVPDDIVGSGKENLYVPDGRSVPKSSEPGKVLYEQGCSTCHGVNGEGSKGVPSLQGVGKASVDFYMGTGRMPPKSIVVQAPRRVPLFSQEQIDAVADYVSTTFGGGPEIPEIDPHNADLSRGMQLYANNCAQCHNSAGSGGSLGRGHNAPRVFQATPVEVAEAVRTGPGAMPKFNEETFDKEQLNDLVAYVDHLGDESPGGLKLGSTGPVPEGYFAWFIGLGAMLLFARWIGTKV